MKRAKGCIAGVVSITFTFGKWFEPVSKPRLGLVEPMFMVRLGSVGFSDKLVPKFS